MENAPRLTDFEFPQEWLHETDSYFNQMAELVDQETGFRHRVFDVLRVRRYTVDIDELEDLLEQAKQGEARLLRWSYSPVMQAVSVGCLEPSRSPPSIPVYPPRLFYCDNAVQASTHIAWRIARILQLDIINRIYQLLRTRWHKATQTDEKRVQSTIEAVADDLCSNIPYYLGWKDGVPPAYAHLSNQGALSRECNLEDPVIIANWSQLMRTTWAAAALPCFPEAKRDWLRGYLIQYTGCRANAFEGLDYWFDDHVPDGLPDPVE